MVTPLLLLGQRLLLMWMELQKLAVLLSLVAWLL
jgi:hypothetical protein